MTLTTKIFVDTAAWADLVLGDADNHGAIETTIRNGLAHGDQIDVGDVPVAAARDLAQRYLDAAVDHELAESHANG